MSPLGGDPPHPVDNTDIQIYFASICLSISQSVCVSVHLFTINLKFLKLLTSSACICEPGFRARIKKMQTAYQNA